MSEIYFFVFHSLPHLMIDWCFVKTLSQNKFWMDIVIVQRGRVSSLLIFSVFSTNVQKLPGWSREWDWIVACTMIDTRLWLLLRGSSVKWVFLHVQRINISLCSPDLAPHDGLWHGGCVLCRLADAVSKLRPRGVKCRFRGRCTGPVTDLWLFMRRSKTNKWKTNKQITRSHPQATEQPWEQNLHSGRQSLRQSWMKVRASLIGWSFDVWRKFSLKR